MAPVDFILNSSGFPLILAVNALVPPLAIIILCLIAGIGTVLLLPGPREASMRWIGGVIVLVAFLVLVAILIRQTERYGVAETYFWIFSAIALIGSIRVVSHPKPVYSALYFVLAVGATAGLFVLLWAEFMAAALVLIYAGAVLVTYVFVIMLAQQAKTGATAIAADAGAEYDLYSREPIVATATGFVLMGVLLFVIFDRAAELPRGAADTGFASTVAGLGYYLFYQQLVSLQVAGLLLLLAMVGAIVIARRRVTPEQPEGATLPPEFDPGDDDPHRIPIYGEANPEHKAYPES